MKNRIFLVVFIVCMIKTYGQIGVNTFNPLQMFHVDAKGNNPTSGIPSVEEKKDDFVVTKDGKVGIGEINPSANLTINGTMRIKDGTEGANKIILSDDNGVGHWERVPYDISTIFGSIENSSTVSWSGTAPNPREFLYSSTFIVLPKGKWVVNMGIIITMSGGGYWTHAILSSSDKIAQQTGFVFNSIAGNRTSYASRLVQGKGMLKGSSVIEVVDESVKIHLLVEKIGSWTFSPNAGQNFLYATPIL